jgi:dienelactone hydrolase
MRDFSNRLPSGLLPKLLLFAAGASALWAQPASLHTALARAILAPRQTTIEVQAYAAARVPSLPAAASAADWNREAERLRQQVLEKVVFRGEAGRWRDAKAAVEWLETIPGGPGYRIRKLRYEIVPGLWAPALLYEPEQIPAKTAVVLNVNGHEADGVAIPYIQERCINLAKRGMLALNPEWIGRGQWQAPNLTHYRMNQLDLCGTSGLSVFYLAARRALDLLLAHPNADPERVAVTGLSGGGWQTILLSALDPRVRLATPVAGYSSYVTRAQFPDQDLGDSEQTPSDLATVADYAHLTAMLAPRAALLIYNARDNCCFQAEHAVAPLVWAARPFFALYGQESRFRHYVNFGPGHNYDRDSREQFYRMLKEQFYAGSARFDVKEIPSEGEIKNADQLRVKLPEDNSDFNRIALDLSRDLPRPGKPDRERLREIIRYRDFQVEAEEDGREEQVDLKVTYWRLKMGAWTVPAVELTRGEPKGSAILVSDSGRAGAVSDARRLLAEGQRVLALDPFYFGESRMASREHLFALLIAAVGDRPLGIQASQVAAAARWLASRGTGPVTVTAIGPRSSLFALSAAAVEARAITGLDLYDPLRSLKDVIRQNMTVEKAPELFCFGLLEAFDLDQIKALVAPRPMRENGK